MKRFSKALSSTIVIALSLCTHGLGAEQVKPVSLRCEYRENPLGIDVKTPRFGWQISGQARGLKQTAYRILVAGSREALAENRGDLWDTGEVKSDQSVFVPYQGKPLKSATRYFWKVRVWTSEAQPSAWSEPAFWSMGLLEENDWKAKWITFPVSRGPKKIVQSAVYQTLDGSVSVDVKDFVEKLVEQGKTIKVLPQSLGLKKDPAYKVRKVLVVKYTQNGKPGEIRVEDLKTVSFSGTVPNAAMQIRKVFDLADSPSSAQITVHSPAYYELYVNGSKVGKDVLTPAVSDLKQLTFTVTYDVTPFLKRGKNCLGLWLGEGWASRRVVRAQLNAVVKGKPVILGTDTSWKNRASELQKIGQHKWGDFGGERLDAREIVSEWSQPGLDDASWAAVVPADVALGPGRNQLCPTNRIGKEIHAVAVTALDKSRYEIDFGTNLTGWFRLKMPKLTAGARIRMTFADSKRNPRARNQEYLHFRQISEFVSAGGSGEVFEHKFNYAAFRYVLVEGLPSAPAKESATAFLVESDLEDAGSFACSNELLNRIHRVNRWTQRCLNLGGYYVDCPHRERMGYGDGQVAAEGFMTSFNAYGYYRKWLGDWRRGIREDGSMPNVAPFYKGGGGPGWGGLLAAVTWRHYLYYGDRSVLAENFDAIRRYVEHLEGVSRGNGDILTGKTARFSFIGDWVAPGRGMDTRNAPSHEARQIFNNCYRVYQIGLLIKMAEVLGKQDVAGQYRKVTERIRPVIHRKFFNAEKTEYVLDDQAYYVMPLMTGVTPEALRAKVFQKLEDCILTKRKGHLDTGMLGTYFMMEYLREIGRSDLVFTMFNKTTYPSWGYMIEKGATTFWEQWNGYWSRIHSCFTSPGNWLYQGLAGIQADPAAPGFKNVILKPDPVGDVTWVKAHHDSAYGRIVSNWKKEGDRLVMEIAIPPNSTATVYVPAAKATDVTVNGHALKEADHVTFRKLEEGRVVLGVDSGRYTISAWNR